MNLLANHFRAAKCREHYCESYFASKIDQYADAAANIAHHLHDVGCCVCKLNAYISSYSITAINHLIKIQLRVFNGTNSRFSDENVGSIQPYTYLPFGAGPRNCIGMRFALQAVKLSLLHSVHSVEFVRTGKTKVPLEFHKGFGILNAKEIIVGIRNRSP